MENFALIILTKEGKFFPIWLEDEIAFVVEPNHSCHILENGGGMPYIENSDKTHSPVLFTTTKEGVRCDAMLITMYASREEAYNAAIHPNIAGQIKNMLNNEG